MKNDAAKTKKRHSLKWSMVTIVLICWVLPVVLAVAAAGCYIMGSLTRQAKQNLYLNTENAMDLTTVRLDAAIASSRKASYIPTVRAAWRSYQEDGETVTLYEAVNTFLYQQYKYDEKFLNTIVTFTALPDTSIYVTNTASGGASADVRLYERYVREEALALSPKLGTKIAFLQEGRHLFLVRNLVTSDYEPFAILVMEINNDLIFHELASQVDTTQATVGIDDVRISLCGDAMTLEPAAYHVGVDTEYADGCLSASAKLVHEDYTISYRVHVASHELKSQRSAAALALFTVALLVAPLIGLMLIFFARKVTRPVNVLMEAAGEIEKGNFGTQVSPQALTSREMGSLGDSFNTMSDTLKNQFERIYKEELALRDARIMALQSQINPHFLNNTLEIINWEARMNGDIKVCNMLESLSTMLCAAMDRKQRPLVHLSEELMYVDAYLYIINERMGKRLTFVKQIDETLLDAWVPRLILQPILENAVEHGITPTQQGTIILRAMREGEWLLLEVENDGKTTEEDLARIHALLTDEQAPAGTGSGSLGLRNVHQRLRILYGEGSGITVKITKKHCTVFGIKIALAQDGQK